MKPQSPHPWSSPAIGTVRLMWLAIFVSVFSFLFFQRQGDILLYGDAVAHINIARRVFDSKTPGLLQLGTVWLPLPHLLILPFIVFKKMWQSGSGGSIPSMAAYVLGTLGMHRLVRVTFTREDGADGVTQMTAWASAIIYAANPNLIYMQATAMGESLYLALSIWAIAYFSEFARSKQSTRPLVKSGLCLAAACWTRYDGWFLAVILVMAAAIITHNLRNDENDASNSRSALVRFGLIVAVAPVLWLAYNAAVYKNPLEFANGPYSAKAIAQKTATVNPANGNLLAAASYFIKAGELNVADGEWQGRLWLVLAVVGSLATLLTGRGRLALLLWVPLPFYSLSIAHGSIPIFIPTWWPFSYYNVRYGLQLLPAFAVFIPGAIYFLVSSAVNLPRLSSWSRRTGLLSLLLMVLLATVSYAAIWRTDPICYREASMNARGRVALDTQLAHWIESLPQDSTFLMYLGEHVGALQQAGIPLRRTINEGNHRVWRQPDPEGLWEHALSDPAAYAEYAIGFDGDPVWRVAKDHHLPALVEIHTTGQPRAAIFQGRVRGKTQSR